MILSLAVAGLVYAWTAQSTPAPAIIPELISITALVLLVYVVWALLLRREKPHDKA
jgi:hypothetical protein